MGREPDNQREEIAGRANVTDTPELLAYYDELNDVNAGALWTVANKIEPWEPQSTSRPVLWRYADLREKVLRSVDLVTPEKAGRRVIYLNNPGRTEFSAAVGWIYAGLQVMHPGENATAHRHSASAIRFIMEGSGAYTVVDGHKMTLGKNDFVLTPNGTWHEHAVEASGTPCIWQDGLDIPFVNAMEANFFEVHPDLSEPVRYPVDDMTRTWGNAGLTPGGGTWDKGYSPMFKYQWDRTYEALNRYAGAVDPSPFDGHLMEYVNPTTNGPVMKTLGASMQRLAPGEATKAHRHTGSYLYQVAKGNGYSVINSQRFDWSERDIFCVPSWAWHEHANVSASDDAVLFCLNDLPVIRALGLYREEALGENDGHQPT
ncbi:cupin domain-containing protein [Sulfitobacter sp. F26204]|uniref:cupin domain-containing protein n=1 Tax=Sulfitobacter sp. F26204 TaxID=2996014 RepID=UPI00225E05E0|nr:cupin domain-containing protein [Sulfitobacter sp. F26204]MCX7561221.1 cupin domain-containing protein [Sulfitobacter sp. F26204]